LERREAALEAEESRNRVFDKKLSKEETWIRQGIKARRTRNEGRVRALKKMRAAFRARRKQSGNVRMQVQEAERTGKLVIEAKNISFLYGATPIIRNFATVIMRGDKVGIIGPNGVGKTTLLKILLKEISPHEGRVRHGTHLQVAYFDQLRAQLDINKTVRTPVHVLSGGEKNRLLLAKLFTRPANVLVLDEPTNDLDVETLELLEKLLLEYQGTLLLVSHDRAFLNNVVTSTLVFEGQGQVNEYAGGYDDWLIQKPQSKQERLPAKKSCNKHGPETSRPKERKLGFNEKRELKELPLKIDTFEAEQKELYAIMSDPMFYKKGKEEIASAQTHLAEVEDQIKSAYLRWEALESLEKG
jgi:ATP-binding cassette subfamily F protein uup